MFELPEAGEHMPVEIYARLLELDQFETLRMWTPASAFIFRTFEEKSAQKQVIGTCSMPSVTGRHRKLFSWMLERLIGFEPVFLYTLDKEWWDSATPRLREILMFHEMQHAGQALDAFGSPRFSKDTGEPIWAIIGHDVEEFSATVARYGAWTPELESFRDALGASESLAERVVNG